MAFQDLTQEVLGGFGVAAPLNEDIEYVAILIDGAPEVMLLATDFDEYFVDVPGIAEPAFAAFQGAPIARPEFETPAANTLVGDDNSSLGKQILNVTEAQAESMIEKNGIADDLRRKSVPMVA